MSGNQFFLGANSPNGFFSYYDEWLDRSNINRAFIIKGTPGNGKSSFMRRIESVLKKSGYEAENIVCSADSGSLDGVCFPALKVAFVDGTAPQVRGT